MGGVCSISPRKLARASSTLSRVTPSHEQVRTRLPSES